MAVPRVLKCYADDSGDAPDPNCNAVAVAGYVGTVESWEVFERLWRSDVLEVHDAPYLHMKQFTGIVPPFEWDETKRRSFLGAAANAIKGSGLRGVSEVIRLDDLRRFNQDRKFGLDPIALALYGCMLSLNVIYP